MPPTDPLAAAVLKAPMAEALLDRSLRYVEYNDRWVAEHGLDPAEDYSGRRHEEVVPGADDAARAACQRALEGVASPSALVPGEGPDGRRRWIRHEARPWLTPDGEVGGVRLVAEDMTAVVEVGRALSHGDALIEAAAHADATIWAFDEDLRMTLHVGAPLEALGVGQGWNVGEDMADVYGDLPGFIDMLERVLASNHERIDVQVADRSFETVASPIWIGDAVRGGIGISLDVTERVRAERRAETQTRNLRTLLQATATQGPFQDRAHAVLRAMTDMLGLGAGFLARIADGDLTCLAAVTAEGEALATGETQDLARTFCDLTIEADDIVAIEHMAESDLRVHPCHQATGLEAYIGAPVRVDGAPYGAISFSSTEPAARPFTEADRELVRLAAQWAGALIERDLRGQEVVAQADRLRELVDTFAVRRADDVDAIGAILGRLRMLLGMDIGILSRVTPELDRYEVVASSAPDDVALAPGDAFELGHTYCSIMLEAGRPIAIDAMAETPHARHPCYQEFGLEAYIGAPVRVDEAVFGTLNFSSPSPRAVPFTEADQDLVRLAAEWVGGAVEREIRQGRLEEAVSLLADARDQADAANRAKSAFLASMSHEIRTPMNAVIGFSDILATTTLDASQLEFIRTIQNAGDRLLGLIDDILDFSKIEAGRVELETTPVSLTDVVVQALQEVAPRAGAKGVELAYTVAPELPRRVQADEKRLLQILANLLSNAVKFTPSGAVDVAVRPARAGAAEGRVEIEVRDTGIGISPERLAAVFEPFVQADGSTTREYGGTGLGLAITRRFVELMGGVLEAESAPGAGSCFRATLPLAPAEAPGRVVLPAASAGLRGRHALVVDDEPTSLERVVRLLTQWGMTADATTAPEEALRWIAEGRAYDIGVLDMVMPSTDGVAVAERIRAQRPASALPLVILSSADQIRYAPGLVSATLAKPVTPSALHDLLCREIDVREGAAAPEPPPSAPLPMAPSGSAAGLRILVVEDEPDNQALALHMLSRLGFHAEVASDGQEALDRLGQHDYDLVLMDVMMPRLDGLEATRRLRRDLPADRQPRVIALTARALRSDREACLAAGMDGFLPKPVRFDSLRSVLTAPAAR